MKKLQATISLTFDNLGEAAEIEQGTWPPDVPLGTHPSVTTVLPRLLDLLGELDLHATFFVEGINTELYPKALSDIASRGHELAYHAWRHERWSQLDPVRERQVLERGITTFREFGFELRGFRPPGGQLTSTSLDLLKELGFTYSSPEGQATKLERGFAILPFSWLHVDAYYYFFPFADLRAAHGDDRQPLPVSLLRSRLREALEDAVRTQEHLTLLFHPFLLEEREALAALTDIVQEIDRLKSEGKVQCLTCHEAAFRLHTQKTV